MIMSPKEILQNEKYQSCIDACMACAESCEFCATSCLREENIKSRVRCIQLDRDCANICLTTSTFMSWDSEYANQLCNTCADICEACAKECKTHQMDHCQKCAEACRRCAQECRNMASSASA